jgi:nitrate reductase assembly molybdenum cofactor insertion protein NarJ
LDQHYPEAGAALQAFTDYAAQASEIELEELFTRSFDVQAITTLDLGYVLFGDDYKRGALLVNLNREHKEVDNPCHNELADHLPNVLRLLPLLQDAELRDEMVEKIIAPALKKMIGEFNPDRISSKKKIYLKHHKTWIERSEDYGRFYQKPLVALQVVLDEDFHPVETTQPRPSADFLKNIGTEIELEAE